MSLNMYLGEVKIQTDSMNSFCVNTIQGMEKVISSINDFAFDEVLQGETYNSAKIYFVQTFRPLAQGIIYLCEELIYQNNTFPSDFKTKVASTDVIEQELLEQIQEINRMKAEINVIKSNLPAIQTMTPILDGLKRILHEKLEKLYKYNSTSSNNYEKALQLSSSIIQGLIEVQSGKGFNVTKGTFSTKGFNMNWSKAIQKFAEMKNCNPEKLTKPVEGEYKFFKGSIKSNTNGMDSYRGKIEGSLIEGEYKLTEGSKLEFKGGHGELELGIPYKFNTLQEDLITGKILGIKGGVTGLEDSISVKNPYVSKIVFTQKFIDTSVAFGIDEYTFKDEIVMSVNKYEAKLDRIDIPNFIPYLGNYDIELRAEYGLGTYGYKLYAGQETGAYIGGGKVGGGIFAKLKKHGEEE